MITRGRPQTSASTVPAHNVRSEAPARWHAAIASPSSAGWALIGPGGWISIAAEPCVDDFLDVDGELSRLAVLDVPEVHPTNTREPATRPAPMRNRPDGLPGQHRSVGQASHRRL
jgi:hypothetical protein